MPITEHIKMLIYIYSCLNRADEEAAKLENGLRNDLLATLQLGELDTWVSILAAGDPIIDPGE
jgi:hypothetical protein